MTVERWFPNHDAQSKAHMKGIWTPADILPLDGKRILVTGANSGIGYHAALVFAQKGAHVIWHAVISVPEKRH